jgi:hypothetical protein
MFEAKKIREAEFFYALLLEEEQTINDSPDRFGWYLSAFLSAARSVLQYVHKEAVGERVSIPHTPCSSTTLRGGKPGGQVWYDTAVSKSHVLQYFKEKRDVNIHKQPINAIREFELLIDDSIWMGAAPPIPGHVSWPVKVTDKYKFDDWPGTEAILTLCIKYVRELRALVQDGQARGLLSP